MFAFRRLRVRFLLRTLEVARPPVRLRQWLTAVRRGGAVYAGLPGSVRLIAGAAPRRAVALMLIYLVAGVAGPAGVWFSKLLVDALTAQRAGAALALAGLYVGLRVLGTAAGWLFEPVWAGFRDRFVFHLHSRLMAKAAAAPDLTLFETPAYYDRLQRARQAVDWAPRLINPAITGVSLVAVLAGLVGTLALLSPLAAAVVVLSALPRYLARVHFGHGSWQVYRGQAPHVRRLDYYFRLLTTAEAAKELRLFDLAGWFLGRYRRTYEGVIEEVEAFRRRQLLPLLGYPSLGALGVGGVLLYTVREAAGGRIGVGDLVLYAGALFLVQDALRSVLDTASGLYDAQLHVAPLTEFLALEVPAAGAPSGARPVPAPWRRGLEVQAVRFRYPGTDRDVLRGVSFTVRPGETLAVVGPNGAGKTTLVKVLCRLYDPCAGRVLLDGVDLRDYDLEAWRRQVSAVFQDFVHYHLTAGENIGVADVARAGDRAALAEAAAQAGAADVLRALPQGLDTPLGRELEPGAELSGGQWQKLALARAYFRDAPLQILDEPTAALDPRAEHEVYQRFRELARGRSTILISHRFSTVRMADRILVLDDGQVVEEGPHESLVRAAGLYADLYEKQASHYR